MRDRGLDWEIHIDDTPRDQWTIQGMRPPDTGSEEEKRWIRENRPSKPTSARIDEIGWEAMTILDRFRIDDRVAIVTGASSGLGVAFAAALADAGADVSLGARREDRLKATRKLVEDAGRGPSRVRTDVASPDDCHQLVDATMRAFGRVDILVNNAGIGTSVPATRETPEQFRSVIDVNLNGCYWMAQACAQSHAAGKHHHQHRERAGLDQAGITQAAYAASKAGLIGLTRDLAQQWTRPQGNSRQCPGSGLLRVRNDRSVFRR